jgi:hypothetical protein
MTKRTMILTAGLLTCVTILFAAGAVAPEQKAPTQQKPIDVFTVASGESTASTVDDDYLPTCVCPCYPWAFHEGYWSYYAIECDGCTAGNLDAEPNLPFTSCPGCWGTPYGPCPENCTQILMTGIPVPSGAKNRGAALRRGYYVQVVNNKGDAGIGKTGFARKRSRQYQVRLNKKIATKKAEFVVKVERKRGEPFLAKLVLVAIDPQRIPNLPKRFSHLRTRMQGMGFEIDEPGTTPVESGNAVTELSGDVVAVKDHPHFYMVRYRHHWYQVICHAGHVR